MVRTSVFGPRAEGFFFLWLHFYELLEYREKSFLPVLQMLVLNIALVHIWVSMSRTCSLPWTAFSLSTRLGYRCVSAGLYLHHFMWSLESPELVPNILTHCDCCLWWGIDLSNSNSARASVTFCCYSAGCDWDAFNKLDCCFFVVLSPTESWDGRSLQTTLVSPLEAFCGTLTPS